MAAVVVTEPITDGRVLLRTSLGEVLIELWSREAPKAVRNFVQLCLEGYYDGCLFHRVVPGFIAQTGDQSGTGTGGECIYDEGLFNDEFNQRLRFTRRGLVAMANQGTRNTNLSQFFFTLDRALELNDRNTIFGRIAGDTLFNVLKLNDIEVEPGTDRPVYPPKILSAEVLDNPFEDIVPRITAAERKEQEKAKREIKRERAQEKLNAKRKGTKNVGLLSFGAEPEEPLDPALAQTKFKSSHDVLTDDPRLRKEVIDDRGMSAQLPAELQGGGLAAAAASNRKADDHQKRARPDPAPVASGSGEYKLERAREAKQAQSESDKVRDQIAKVEADLKRMTRGQQDDDDSAKRTKKPKRSGPSLLQLEREKYIKGAAASKKKDKKDDLDLGDALAGFRAKLFAAGTTQDKAVDDGERDPSMYGVLLDDADDDDDGWLSHSLKFRKDATMDQHTADEYAVHDPLSKNELSLSEMQEKRDQQRRYPGEREGGAGRGGGDRGGRGGGRRDDGRPHGPGQGQGQRYGERSGGDRGGARRDEGDDRRGGYGGEAGRSTAGGSWKEQKVGRESLA